MDNGEVVEGSVFVSGVLGDVQAGDWTVEELARVEFDQSLVISAWELGDWSHWDHDAHGDIDGDVFGNGSAVRLNGEFVAVLIKARSVARGQDAVVEDLEFGRNGD